MNAQTIRDLSDGFSLTEVAARSTRFQIELFLTELREAQRLDNELGRIVAFQRRRRGK